MLSASRSAIAPGVCAGTVPLVIFLPEPWHGEVSAVVCNQWQPTLRACALAYHTRARTRGEMAALSLLLLEPKWNLSQNGGAGGGGWWWWCSFCSGGGGGGGSGSGRVVAVVASCSRWVGVVVVVVGVGGGGGGGSGGGSGGGGSGCRRRSRSSKSSSRRSSGNIQSARSL